MAKKAGHKDSQVQLSHPLPGPLTKRPPTSPARTACYPSLLSVCLTHTGTNSVTISPDHSPAMGGEQMVLL